MKPTTSAYNSEIAASCRSLRSQVVCNGTTYTSSNYIKKIDIEATPIDGKHFGFSVSQKCVVTFLENSGTFTVGSTFVPSIGTSSLLIDYQPFYIDTVDVDKKSGDITVTGYDAISLLNKYTYGDLNYSSGTTKTLSQILTDIASKIGLSVTVTGGANLSRSYSYNNINATSDTTLRAILDALCEVTGTYAYMGLSNLCVRQLPSASVLNINKNVSFEQTISDVSTLSGIAAVNALENTITVGTTNNYVQVINDNAFLSLLTDAEITTILTAVKAVVPTNIYSYDITWAANPALEYGDMVNIYTDDTHYTTTYYLGEILSYDGGLKTSSTWSKTDSPAIDANASTTVSSSIKRAEAKVDKVNAEIDLKVSKDEIISSINLTPEAIKISSEKINLNGYVTFTDLSTATNPPTTIINGNNITTGTISADRIDVNNLKVKYFEYTSNIESQPVKAVLGNAKNQYGEEVPNSFDFSLSAGTGTMPQFYMKTIGSGVASGLQFFNVDNCIVQDCSINTSTFDQDTLNDIAIVQFQKGSSTARLPFVLKPIRAEIEYTFTVRSTTTQDEEFTLEVIEGVVTLSSGGSTSTTSITGEIGDTVSMWVNDGGAILKLTTR